MTPFSAELNLTDIDDLILGAPSSPGSNNTDKSYVVLGFKGSSAPAIAAKTPSAETVTATPDEIGSDFRVASGDPLGGEPVFGSDGLRTNSVEAGDPSGGEPDFGPDGSGVEAGNPTGGDPDFGPDGLYVNFDELIGMSQTVAGTDNADILTSPQAAGAETHPDYFLGYGGHDTFVLGNEEEVFYLNNAEAVAIVGDFEVGIDQIQLHGSVADYSLGASSAQTDTAIIHNETQQVVGWIVGISRSELIGSSAFTFVSNYDGPPAPPPNPDPVGAL